MTIAELRTRVLALVDELKPQTGMVNRMNIFIDMGQKEIATTAAFIYRELEVICEEDFVDTPMPLDYFMLDKVYRLEGGRRAIYNRYNWLDNRTMRLNGKGEYIISYKAYPTTITKETEDTHSLEITEEAQLALVLYVAAQLFAAESEQQFFQSFFSQYQGKLVNIGNKRVVSIINGGGVI